MRMLVVFYLFLLPVAVFAQPEGAMLRAARSLLTVQKFPKTFNDLTFVERTSILAEGYEPWESEYDSAGRCISGCAYNGITIEEELKAMQRQTENAVQELREEGLLPNVLGGGQVMPQSAPVRPVGADVPSRPQIGGVLQENTQLVPDVDVPGRSEPLTEVVQNLCSLRNSEIKSEQGVPVGEPVIGRPRISSPFGERIHPITKKRQTHKGVDFAVPMSTNIFVPAAGVVTGVWTDSTCGVALKIKHDRGYETVYCHLSKQLVREGERVEAGCLIGLTGNTGRSTGPHLHYGIKKDGVYIDPAQLLGR